MTVHILLGSAGAGKTHACIQRLLKLRRQAFDQPLWVLVPDRLQAVDFRRRVARSGGALGIQVGTFEDLYRDILAQAGRPTPQAPETVVQVLMRDAVLELAKADKLTHYDPIADTAGFAQRMAESIAELKRSMRTPGDLAELDDTPGLKDMAAIYKAYQEHLRAVGWEDREGLAELVTESLNEKDSLWSEPRALFVDGFDSLEISQLQVLRILAERMPEMWLTLPGNIRMERAAFRRFRRSLQHLQETFPDAEVTEVTAPDEGMRPELRGLEQGLFNREVAVHSEPDAVQMLEVRNPAEEAREALRWIKARIRRNGFHPDECALVVPDPERYRPLLKQAAGEFGLRIRANFGERLPRAPSVAALLDLLQLPLDDWPRRSTLDTVRSPYFDLTDWDLESDDALALDAVSRHGQVVKGIQVWQESLARLAKTTGIPEREDERVGAEAFLPSGDAAHRLRDGISNLADRLDPPSAQSVAEWVRWMEDLLDDLSFPDRVTTEEEQAAFRRLRDTLRALLLGQSLGSERELSYRSFLDRWRATLEGVSFRRRLEPQQPAITVLRLLEARGLRYRAVAILGLSEGLIPEVEREDPFLPEDVRTKLDLESRLERDQTGLFYQAATRADEQLLLTRPYLADDGQLWEPSPYWRSVERQFPDAVERMSGEAPQDLVNAGSPQELLFWGVRRGSLPESLLGDHAARWHQLRRAADVLAARQAAEAGGPFEGFAQPPPELGAGQIAWSPSRLETYGTCPHFFWVSYVLGIDSHEPPELGFDAAQLGSMLHAILERAYQEAENPTEVASVITALNRVCDEAFKSAPETYGFRPTPLWELEQEQLRDVLVETVRGMADFESGWTPTAFEAAFGVQGAPGLEIELSDGRTLQVRGLIDRVDKNPNGELRVLDYKTGSSHMSERDLVEGRRLQLPLYAQAAERALKLGKPVEGLYWSIMAGKPSSLRLSDFYYQDEEGSFEGPAGAFDIVVGHIEKSISAIESGRFPPEPPRGGCPSYCPAAAWCWRYTPSEYG